MSSPISPRAGIYLGFDYGSVRIGLATGNTLLGTAKPLNVAANHNGTPDWAAIDSALAEWDPVGLVIGIPLTESGEEQEMTRHARGFLRKLKKRSKLPVFEVDERYSSIEAQQELKKMRARGQRGKTQHADTDTLSAALILERWFALHTFV